MGQVFGYPVTLAQYCLNQVCSVMMTGSDIQVKGGKCDTLMQSKMVRKRQEKDQNEQLQLCPQTTKRTGNVQHYWCTHEAQSHDSSESDP